MSLFPPIQRSDLRPIRPSLLPRRSSGNDAGRRGIVTVLAVFMLVVLFAFVALSVDTGAMIVAQTNLQNAADAASLAASQEVVRAIQDYTTNGSQPNVTMDSYAASRARIVAQEIASANGAYLDPAVDVSFGRRLYRSSDNTWPITWNAEPFNVVKVTLRRENVNVRANGGQLPLSFGWAVGKNSVPLRAVASAFVESRDLVLILDQSGSMNDDSSFGAMSSLGKSTVDKYLDKMWDELQAANPKWNGTSESKFPSTLGRMTTKAGITDNYSTSSSTVTSIRNTISNAIGSTADSTTVEHLVSMNLHLTNSNGTPKYPFPQVGTNSNGTPKSRPSQTTSLVNWYYYCVYVNYYAPSPYRGYYGFRTLIGYLEDYRESYAESEDLWRTSHYPFASVKNGATMFCDFLGDLNYGDQLGYVSYATTARWETSLNQDGYSVNLGSNPLTDDYQKINLLQRHMQAGHYTSTTAIGDGILKAREMLFGNGSTSGHLRDGARPTLVLMTDGLANEAPNNWSAPSSFKWSDYTDFDGNGSSDYSTNDVNKKYAFYQAMEAYKKGAVIHTMSVGDGADTDFMKAIARATGGEYINVPGGRDAIDMEDDLLEAFRKIASMVPPSKLVYDNASN